MTSPPPSASRRPSAATIILALAALIALVSAGVAISRSLGGGGGDADSPAAKDWRVVGWAYAQAGNAAEAASAYRKAAAIEPDNAENWSSLGEALQVASATPVAEAAAAFRKAIEIDPRDPRARYFLAVQKDLGGDHKGAVEDWLAFLRDTPPGAPWEADLRRTIEQSAAKNRIDLAGRMPAPGGTGGATAGIPGPSPEQIAAASSIPPGEQDAMVQQMLARLEGKLKANPKDEEGWIRLMRSRMVLGDKPAAQSALRSGLAAFGGDSASQGRLRSAAAELGVPNAG
ncbi:MAG: cytochrome c-type biosis protein CcmH [Sphingomonadales bacterium]|jgi:cytochrome c-type biogenesis protein CcmH|nr:cytochrome c-type biosis protein CcmH [Sphingomonadales bacterium]